MTVQMTEHTIKTSDVLGCALSDTTGQHILVESQLFLQCVHIITLVPGKSATHKSVEHSIQDCASACTGAVLET